MGYPAWGLGGKKQDGPSLQGHVLEHLSMHPRVIPETFAHQPSQGPLIKLKHGTYNLLSGVRLQPPLHPVSLSRVLASVLPYLIAAVMSIKQACQSSLQRSTTVHHTISRLPGTLHRQARGSYSHEAVSPAGAVLNEVEHGEAVDDDEVVPASLSNALHDRNGEAHPVLVAPSPFVLSVHGPFRLASMPHHTAAYTPS